ncbi:NAD-dependent succinate-semialdehyde dehydrogenase [Prauserella oleivorans]|uniref:NAD-dependent succinate-semialdehyde dehydrogenase n=1 Tax=Prauserella oleivorans TaxID=1478153 RepID=A0ABW5WE30_9PSEU
MTQYATVDPTNGRLVREFATISDTEVARALDSAQAAFLTWRETDVEHRAATLTRVAELHREHAQEMAELMTLEMGKPISEARREVELSASIYDYYAIEGVDLLADEELKVNGPGRAFIRQAPIGALLGIMPWNFPYYQVARFVAPNLLLGNTVLLKHASSCPQQALRIEELLREAGTPDGVYQNVFASSAQVADMIAHPAIQGVSLTGSERAGSAVGAVAGQHLKKCVLELGGSDPLIVLPGVDIEHAVSAAVAGRFFNGGQACTSSKRIIVDTQVWDKFVAAFVEMVGELTMGDPREECTQLGPMASTAARADLAAQVDDALAKGATAHVGAVVPEGDGAYYPATVLSGVTPQMRAWHEELFGPVAVLYQVGSVDEAVALANDSPYGLGGAVFGPDPDEAARVADRLDVGMVGVNQVIRSAPELPFGGVKNSGTGRELGRLGLEEFANKKLIRTP